MTITIKDAPEVINSSKPGASAQASEVAPGQSPRSNPVCLEVPIVVRSLPGEEGNSSGSVGPSRQEGRSVIVFDDGGVLRVANPLPAGQKVILSNPQGRDVVCRVVSGRSLPNVKGYIEVEFIEPVSDFWQIHQTPQPAGGPPPVVPVLPIAALQQPPSVAKAPAASVATRATAMPKEMETSGDADSGGAPTFDDVAGLVLMSPAVSSRDKKSEAPSASAISKNKIESVPRPAESLKPTANHKTPAVSDLDFEGISALSTPETISPALPREVFSGDVFGRTMQMSATSSTVTLSGEPRGRMPLLLGVAALLLAGLGAGYYFTHQTNSPAPGQPVAVTTRATPRPTDASTGPETSSVTKPVAEETPVPAAVPAVAASAADTGSAPLDSQNVRQRTNAAEIRPPDLATARRPAILSLKMSSPSASGKALANLPDGSPADSVDISPSVAPGAGSPGTFTARMENQLAPMPAPVAPIANSTGVVPAKLVSSTRPVYPAMAKSTNVQGNVEVTASINEEGAVTAAKAVSGPVALRQAGVDAVLQWKYSPAMTSGRPSPTQITITLEFRLK